MHISNSYLKRLSGTNMTFTKGFDYYKSGRVYFKDVDEGEALVRGSGENVYQVYVRPNDKGDALSEYNCTCRAFRDYYGICKHIIAAVLAMQDVVEDVPASTDYAGTSLINRYAKRIVNNSVAVSGSDAEIDVSMDIDYGGIPQLSFKIGVGKKKYIINDIPSFISRMKNSEEFSYGKYLNLLHHTGSFAHEDRSVVDFIMNNYDERYTVSSRSGYYYYGTSKTDKRYFSLTAYVMDEFFDMFSDSNKKIIYDDVPLRFKTTGLRPKVTLKKSGEGYVLSAGEKIIFFNGRYWEYALTNNKIYRCSKEFTENCSDLIKTLNQKKSIFFSKDALVPLYSSVISGARPFIDLEADGGIEEFIPPALVTKIYLSSETADSANCGMVFTYGGNSHSAFSPINLSRSFDIAGEVYARNVVIKYFGKLLNDDNRLFIEDDPDAIFRLLSEGIPEFQSFAEVYADESFSKLKIRPPASVNVGVKVRSDLLRIDFSLEDIDLSELSGILDSYKKSKKYHRLRDGSFVMLEQNDSLSSLSELSQGLGLDENMMSGGYIETHMSRAVYIDEMMKKSEDVRYDRDDGFKAIIRGMHNVGDANFAVPQNLKRILRNYQKTGYRWLRTLENFGFGGILADDMGLGKTLQVLALLESYKTENQTVKPSIVICPSSLLLNWESEARKFTPSLRVYALTGSAEERGEIIAGVSGNADLVVTSYDQLKRDISRYENCSFQYIILDEAQYIKNSGTQNAKSVKLLSGKTRIALTGTPVENSLAEIWSVFDFIMPGYLFTYPKFRKKYESPIVKNSDKDALERLRSLVRPFLLRRLKSDVLKELPEKTETVLRSPMEEEQKKVYTATLAHTKKELAEKLGSTSGGAGEIIVLAAITKLRQICCSPSLIYEDYKGNDAKLESLMELIESCIQSGHRILLFSQFTSMLEIIAKQLEKSNTQYYLIRGSTPPPKRLDLVNQFNAGGTPVFLISLKAGGTGLNLTGADVVIHYDPWWNLSAQNQATDRAHRIGQKKNVQVYKLILKDSIEERILELQDKKAALAGQIVREGGNAFEKLTREELLSLFDE